MTTRVQQILEEASSLTEAERADLAILLLEGLESGEDPGAEEAWSEEIGRRVNELRLGLVKTIPWEQVRKEALRALHAGPQR